MPASRSLSVRDEGECCMAKVFIGVDPHKLSATIEVVDDHERCWRRAGSPPTRPATPRCASTSRRGRSGCGRSRAAAAPAGRWRNGCSPTASTWSTCPPKLSARARLFDTGHDRKTDAHDAHAVAVVAVRTKGLRVLCLRRRARGAADAGRPPRRAHPATDPDRQPAATTALRAHAREGQEGHHRPAGQGDPRLGAAPRPGREDPPPARRRAADRAGRGREEDQGADQGAQGDGRSRAARR